MGFHPIDLLVILLVGLLIFGPKTLQSMAHKAGKGVSQAKDVKNKIMEELPVQEISNVVQRVPLSPQQAVQMLITPGKESLATRPPEKEVTTKPLEKEITATTTQKESEPVEK